ncbi:MAG TPA: DUF3000 domain-containing protein, partial [Candidatus Nanopelagicales bacterium]|nr:DUF3000 domain-containing protein [Candidatus Nanopelagicales bacterium]
MTARRRNTPTGEGDLPAEFTAALTSLRAVEHRPEIDVAETPAPQRLAPHAVALLGEVVVDDEEIASGRFVLLHDPDGQQAWDGTFRVVSFVRARVELEMAGDPMVTQVAWTWLLESLQDHGATWTAPSGTVTRTASESFGSLADRAPVGEVEIRASWTPLD